MPLIFLLAAPILLAGAVLNQLAALCPLRRRK